VATGPEFETRFHALVLAAGSASRFGGRKLLADWGGAPLLHAALAAARAAPVDGITVVTGADAAEVSACVEAFDPAIGRVHAREYAQGMAASLNAGVAALPDWTEAVFVFLGDMPRVPHAVLAALADAVRAGAPAAVPVFQGRRGNPVLLGREVFGAISGLSGDTGARPVLQALGARVALVESPDDGVLFDVDTPGDLTG
jgi:molybdenum cofactor cytidylyltransferase